MLELNNAVWNIMSSSSRSCEQSGCQSPFPSFALYHLHDGFVSWGHHTACKHIQYESLHQYSFFPSHIPPSLTHNRSNCSQGGSLVFFFCFCSCVGLSGKYQMQLPKPPTRQKDIWVLSLKNKSDGKNKAGFWFYRQTALTRRVAGTDDEWRAQKNMVNRCEWGFS